MKFELGNMYTTRGVNDLMCEDVEFAKFVHKSIKRYVNGDWGEMCDEDKETNDFAVKEGERILGHYQYKKDVSIYIITEWDRSATTILFPEEY